MATSICEFLLKPKDNNIIQETTEDTPSGRPKRSAAIKASAKGIIHNSSYFNRIY